MEESTRTKIGISMKGNSNHKGYKQDFMSKVKIRNGNRGYVWWTDGYTDIKAKESPGVTFVRGRSLKTKNTNHSQTTKGRQWYNDGVKNYLLAEPPLASLNSGRMHFGMKVKKNVIEKAKNSHQTK